MWLTSSAALLVLGTGLLPLTSAQHDPAQHDPAQQQPLFSDTSIYHAAPDRIRQVAIIGAGPAGSSTAYHLRRFATLASIPLNITIYDTNPYIGGRSTPIHAFADPAQPALELGASIFVHVNHILVNASRDLGLSTSASLLNSHDDDAVPDLGVYDGRRFVFVQAGANGYWDLAKLVWRYGLAPWRTLRLMRATVGKFLRFYEAPVFPFADLTAAVAEVGLEGAVAVTGETMLEVNGVGVKGFGHDVVQASTRVNYAQNLGGIHGLETMVCMATDGAMSVEGGNWRIFDGMVKTSGAARALGTKVGAVRREEGSLVVQAGSVEGDGLWDARFDEVVVAAPMQFTGIKWHEDVGLEHTPDVVPYVKLHVTLFTSPHRLAPTAFGMVPGEVVPRAVLTTTAAEAEEGPEFLSISALRDVINPKTGGKEFAYKIFTMKKVDAGFLRRILGLEGEGDELNEESVSWIYRKVWNSYPYELPRVTFEPTKLGKDVWYTAGMESFISTMETNALMGMNVARLMVDGWMEKGM